MFKLTTATAIFSMALVLGLAAPMKADIIATIGNYDGTPVVDFDPADYPLTPVLIGAFSFTIPTGESVIGGTISGTFGNDDVPDTTESTAPSDYYIDNNTIEVASCDDSLTGAACDTSSAPTSWSYTLTASDLSNLSAELSQRQYRLYSLPELLRRREYRHHHPRLGAHTRTLHDLFALRRLGGNRPAAALPQSLNPQY